MSFIDIPTLLLLFVLTNTSIAVFFIIDAILYKKKDITSFLYIGSKIIQALAVVSVLVQGYPENPALIISHNVLYFLGFTGEIYIILAIKTSKKRLHRNVLFSGVILACIYNISNLLTHGLMAYRIFVIGLFTFFLFIYFGLVLLLSKDNSRMQKITGWISCVFSIPWGLRTFYALLNLSSAGVLQSTFSQTSAYMADIVFFTVLPMLYLFINKEQDQEKLKLQYRKIATQNNEIKQANAELKALNATKDQFFRIIGHDLKSPIGQMIQFTQIIEARYKSLSNEKLLDLIGSLKESSERGFRLLENLLDWAQSQTGNISFDPEPIILSELIRENIELQENQAVTKGIRIVTPEMCEEVVLVDRNMINTVVRNLLSNAIKFTCRGGEIEISCHTDEENAIVSVKDNGVGMSSGESSNLFSPIGNQSTEGTNNEKGTGIGLLLCKEFIDKHGGDIRVESEAEKGSVFSFTIPLKSKSI